MEEQHMELLICPKCAAPAEINNVADVTKPITCLFCGSVYALREREDDAEKIKQELMAWLEKLMVGTGSSSVDVGSRHHTFSESMYPSLQREVDRYLEDLGDVFESPLVHLKPMIGFSEYQPGPLLVAIGQGENHRLKMLLARVSAQQVQDFAVLPTDRLKLRQLRLRVQSMIYLANIAHQLMTPAADSYKMVRQNLEALQQAYQAYVHDIVDDERYRSYMMAVDARMRGDLLLLDVLILALDERRGVAAEATLSRLRRAITQLEKAQQQADACTYNALDTVPLQQGVQKDITVARVFEAVVHCYEVVTRAQSIEFERFYQQLTQYVYGLAKPQSADHLLWLLTSVHNLLQARFGGASVPAVIDWSWLDLAMESTRRRSLFGLVGEKSEVMQYHYHPYWVAEVNYTEVGGRLSKKGMIRDGLLLLDATALDRPIGVFLAAHDAPFPLIQASMDAGDVSFADKHVMALPPLVGREMAERAIRAGANEHLPEWKIINIRMRGVVYLPAASIRYTERRRSREMIVDPLHAVDQHVSDVLRQTRQFFQAYDG